MPVFRVEQITEGFHGSSAIKGYTCFDYRGSNLGRTSKPALRVRISWKMHRESEKKHKPVKRYKYRHADVSTGPTTWDLVSVDQIHPSPISQCVFFFQHSDRLLSI